MFVCRFASFFSSSTPFQTILKITLNSKQSNPYVIGWHSSFSFCVFSGFTASKQKRSSLSSLAQLAKKDRLTYYLNKLKRPTFWWVFLISGRRGSNSRHPPWQGGILPLNYPRIGYLLIIHAKFFFASIFYLFLNIFKNLFQNLSFLLFTISLY